MSRVPECLSTLSALCVQVLQVPVWPSGLSARVPFERLNAQVPPELTQESLNL